MQIILRKIRISFGVFHADILFNIFSHVFSPVNGMIQGNVLDEDCAVIVMYFSCLCNISLEIVLLQSPRLSIYINIIEMTILSEIKNQFNSN